VILFFFGFFRAFLVVFGCFWLFLSKKRGFFHFFKKSNDWKPGFFIYFKKDLKRI
tara:strand:- start:1713 stop:1877 length:165 start_codon:yes stop_codon:yes gene_type:complete